MNKKDLSERDICCMFIGPAVKRAGWDGMMQIREEVAFTKGRIIVRGKLVTRGKAKRADYILYYKPKPRERHSYWISVYQQGHGICWFLPVKSPSQRSAC
jgi:type I restriction enzyme R subunit